MRILIKIATALQKKLGNKKIYVYWVPVIVTSQLKVVRLPVFAAAVNVNVAWIICPAAKTVF